MATDLDSMVRVQDALDAMDDTSCITRTEFIKCNKQDARPLYAAAWDEARALVQACGSLARAANHIAKLIEREGSDAK